MLLTRRLLPPPHAYQGLAPGKQPAVHIVADHLVGGLALRRGPANERREPSWDTVRGDSLTWDTRRLT